MTKKKDIQSIASYAGADAERLATLLGAVDKLPTPSPEKQAPGKVIQFPSR